MVEDYKVHTMMSSPTAMRAIRKDDPNGEFINKYNISSLDSLFLVGERAGDFIYFYLFILILILIYLYFIF